MKEGIQLRTRSPRRVTERIRILIRYLEVSEASTISLEYKVPKGFTPEPLNCHFNVWVQCNEEGGTPQHGWLLAEDAAQDFAEAQFHTVWQTSDGALIDITPRKDHEKRVLFVPDVSRSIRLTNTNNGLPAIVTYANVKVHNRRLICPLKEIITLLDTEFIYEHGLTTRPINR